MPTSPITDKGFAFGYVFGIIVSNLAAWQERKMLTNGAQLRPETTARVHSRRLRPTRRSGGRRLNLPHRSRSRAATWRAIEGPPPCQGDVAALVWQLDPDQEADPANESPEDMMHHVAGLMLRRIREVLPDA